MASKNLIFLFSMFALVMGGFSSALISKAQAQFYVSGNLGGTYVMEADSTDTVTGGSIAGDLDFDPGVGVTGAVGYAWDDLRLEGEISFRYNNLDSLSVSSVTTGGTTFATAVGSLPVNGAASTLGFMANAWYDFDTGTPWTPFIGGGAGGAYMNLDISSVGGTPVIYDESDLVIAYQGSAGLAYQVNSLTSVNVSYRLFGTMDPTFSDDVDVVKTKYMNHSLMIGVLKKF